MKIYDKLHSASIEQKLLILLICVLLGSIVTGVISMASFFVLGIEATDIVNGHGNVAILKILQLITTLGLIGLPGYIAIKLFKYKDYKSRINPVIGIFIILFSISVLPINEWLGVLNHQLSLPEWMSSIEHWIYQSEENASQLVARFLQMNSVFDLLFNVILIALVPAICEELLFRGALQRIFHERFGIHLSVILAAAIFSAFHMQFLGFLPRFLLGLFFGYFYAWSGKIIYPIIGHFTNNAFLVVLVFFMGEEVVQTDTAVSAQSPFILVLLSLVISSSLMYGIYKLTEKKA